MPKQTKNCRVCGKAYEACRSIKTGSTVFNWREVACSPECGKIYLQRVMASRSEMSQSNNSGTEDERRASRKKKPASVVMASDTDTSSVTESTGSGVESCEE